MDNPEEQFETARSDRLLNRAAQLKTELVMVERKREALAQFMAEARSHQDDLVAWFASFDGDHPGAELGLTVSNNGTIWFDNTGE